MEVDERTISNLMRLGLTKYEALAYIALVRLGSGTVAEIHKLSGVPTTKLYEVLSRLESKGWVEVLRERPLRFRAKPPDEVLDAVTEELVKACEDVKTALKEIYGRGLEVEKPDVWMVRGLRNVENKMLNMIKGARKNVYLMVSRLAAGFLDKARRQLLSSYWQGVDVKVLAAEAEEVPDLGGIEVVVLRPPLVAPGVTIVYSLLVVDSEELMLVLPIGVSKGSVRDVVGVWVRDKSLASLAAEYSTVLMKLAREFDLGLLSPA